MIIQYRDLRLQLELAFSAGILTEFLKQYFIPYFEFHDIDDSQNNFFVRLSVRLGMPDDVPDFTNVDSFVVDGSKAFLNCQGIAIENDSIRWIRLYPFDAIVQVNRLEKQVILWGSQQENLRIPTLRLIEDLFSNQLQNHGAIFIHASAISANGAGVIAVGNKGAGKTTILSRLLGNFDVSKMANDSVCLWVEEEGIIVRGWPAFFKVSVGTIATTRELTSDYPEQALDVIDNDLELWNYYDKVALYPRQASERFGSAIVPQAKLVCLVFPQFNFKHCPLVERVSFRLYADTFDNFLQGIHNPNHPEWLYYNPVNMSNFEKNYKNITNLIEKYSIEVYTLNWSLSLEDLLCRIPLLRKHNKNINAARNKSHFQDNWQSL